MVGKRSKQGANSENESILSTLLSLEELERLSNDELQSLMVHFRGRIRNHEKECYQVLEKLLDDSNRAHENLGEARTDLAAKVDESGQLQQALTDAAIQLFRERELALELRMQNDQLRVQEMDDRRRIKQLIDLAKSQEGSRPEDIEEVTFFRDCRPGATQKENGFGLSRQNLNQKATSKGRPFGRHTNRRAVERAALQENGFIPTVAAPRNAQNVKEKTIQTKLNGNTSGNQSLIRTVYLPSAQTDHLVAQVEQLQLELQNEKQRINQRIETINANKKAEVLQEEIGDRKSMLLETSKQLDLAEFQLRKVVADLVEAKIFSKSRDRQLMEESEMLISLTHRMEEEMKHTKESLTNEVKSRKEKSLKDTAEELAELRRDTVQVESQLTRLRRVYDEKHSEWDGLESKLKQALEGNRKKLRSLKQRCRFDLEGFANDLGILAKQVAFLDRSGLDESLDDAIASTESDADCGFVKTLRQVLSSQHHSMREIPKSKDLSESVLDEALQLLSDSVTSLESSFRLP